MATAAFELPRETLVHPVGRTTRLFTHRAAYAIAAGVTLAAVVRKGGFSATDAFVLPGVMVVLAVIVVRTLSDRDRLVLSAVLAFCTWWMLAGVWWGVPSRAALLFGSVLGFGAAFALGRSMDEAHRSALHAALVALGVAVAVLGLVGLAFHVYPLAMPHDGLWSGGKVRQVWRAAGPFTYANAAGLVLAFTAPLAATLEVPPRLRRLAVFLILTGLVTTMSRGALLALLLAVPLLRVGRWRESAWPATVAVAAGGACVVTAASSSPQPLVLLAVAAGAAAVMVLRPPLRVSLGAMAAGAVLLVAVSAASTAPSVLGSRMQATTLGVRGQEWGAALQQAWSSPWAGVGPERNLSLGADQMAYFAHNEYLQVVAGGGLVALVLLGALVYALGKAADRTTERSAAAAAGLLVVAIAGLFDFTWHIPAVGITAGWLASLSSERKET